MVHEKPLHNEIVAADGVLGIAKRRSGFEASFRVFYSFGDTETNLG